MLRSVSRRSFVLSMAALATATMAGAETALAATERGSGTTLRFDLERAPFPHASAAYADRSVWVYIPPSFQVRKSGALDFVVHFHGHNTTAKKALSSHKLREQLASAKQNALLVVPQGPIDAADGSFGKLMETRGLSKLLEEVRRKLIAEDPRQWKGAKKLGRVVVSAHSGGYRAAAAVVARGGVNLREVFLFDALYGEKATFEAFVKSDPKRHKLVSYYVGGAPKRLSLELAQALESSGVRVVKETGGRHVTREDLTKGRAVFLEGRGIHATATWEENALRDCLYASCLRGNHDGTWFSGKSKPRAS